MKTHTQRVIETVLAVAIAALIAAACIALTIADLLGLL